MHWLRLQAETLAREEGGPERVVTQGLSVPEPVVAMLREHAAFLQEQGQSSFPTCRQAALLLVATSSRPAAFTLHSKPAALAGTSLLMQSGPSMLRAAAWPSSCNMCTAEQYLL